MERKLVLTGILLIILAAGFVITTWDRTDEGVKILSEDDYDIIIEESNIYNNLSKNQIPEFSYIIETIEPEIICYGDVC